MSEQFVLKWHYQEFTILKNLTTFLENDVLTDVTISVDSHCVKAHKLVLAMCSVYFFQLFQEMENTQHPVIVLHNVELSDIKAVLAFIYRGQCVVNREQMPGLLSLAKLLKIQGLCDMKVPEKPTQNNTTSEKRPTLDTPIENLPKSTQEPDKILSKNTNWEKPPEPRFPETQKHEEEDDNYNNLFSRKPPKDLSETCKCFLCGKYLSNQYNLRVHMETHEEAYHACQSCPHVSRSRDALRKHVSYRHPEEYHTRKRKRIT